MKHLLAASALLALAGCTSSSNGSPNIQIVPGCTISGEWSASVGFGGAATTSGRFDCKGAAPTASAATMMALPTP